jgi:hypothetical protein
MAWWWVLRSWNILPNCICYFKLWIVIQDCCVGLKIAFVLLGKRVILFARHWTREDIKMSWKHCRICCNDKVTHSTTSEQTAPNMVHLCSWPLQGTLRSECRPYCCSWLSYTTVHQQLKQSCTPGKARNVTYIYGRDFLLGILLLEPCISLIYAWKTTNTPIIHSVY